jgi:secondary thiamine-phosphate synthase enzyme
MTWYQKEIILSPKRRGFHLVTREILSQVPQIAGISTGLAHIFIQHSSASLALNENADPTVRQDMESHFNVIVPEDAPYYIHTYEGPDDMPAHIKAVLLGSSLTLPITNGRLNLGTWQGIYLCEHRDRARSRRLVVTVHGQDR